MRINRIRIEAIQTQVRNVQATAIRREYDTVRMRRVLAWLHRPEGPRMSFHRAPRSDLSIRFERKSGHTPSPIIGGYQHTPAILNRHMAGSRPAVCNRL